MEYVENISIRQGVADFLRKKNRDRTRGGLRMTAMIDVIFLLLIFFMVTTTFRGKETGINIKLPKSSIEEVVETKEIIITITKNKDIYINTKRVGINSFEKALRQTL